MLLGSAIGAFFAGTLADRFGRRTMLIIAAILFIISAFGSGYVSSEWPFVFYRILGGLAVGAASVMAPAYISEVAPAHIRGRLASLQQVAIIAGLFLAFVSNYFYQKPPVRPSMRFGLGFKRGAGCSGWSLYPL